MVPGGLAAREHDLVDRPPAEVVLREEPADAGQDGEGWLCVQDDEDGGSERAEVEQRSTGLPPIGRGRGAGSPG